jgi:hypothetical protein
MIGRRNAHGVNGFVGDDFAEVLNGFDGLAAFGRSGYGFVQMRLINVANSDRFGVG